MLTQILVNHGHRQGQTVEKEKIRGVKCIYYCSIVISVYNIARVLWYISQHTHGRVHQMTCANQTGKHARALFLRKRFTERQHYKKCIYIRSCCSLMKRQD